jgi:hypothetical protein
MPDTTRLLATSSGSPMRPIGMVDAIHAITSAGCRFVHRRTDWTRANNIRPDMPIFEIRSPMAVAAEINDGDVGFHNVHTFQGLAADKNNEA